MAGCASSNTSDTSVDVSAFENCGAGPMGLYAFPGRPVSLDEDAFYSLVAKRNKPSNITNQATRFYVQCEAMLRARGLIYWKSNIGDCGSPVGAPGGVTSGQIVGLSGTAASGVIGGLGAAGVLSGAATLGIGTAVSLAVAGIEGIFAHHAQAVANEQATICSVANYFNPLVRQIDDAVSSGAITSDQGITYMQQVAQQAINGLQSIYQNCNAACWYIGFLKAFIDHSRSFYPSITPITVFAQAPASAPSTFGTPPAGVPDTGYVPPPVRSTQVNTYLPAGPPAVNSPGGSAPPLTPNKSLAGAPPAPPPGNVGPNGGLGVVVTDYLNRGYNQQTGQSGQAADVPNTTNWVMIGALAAVVAAFVAVLAVVRA